MPSTTLPPELNLPQELSQHTSACPYFATVDSRSSYPIKACECDQDPTCRATPNSDRVDEKPNPEQLNIPYPDARKSRTCSRPFSTVAVRALCWLDSSSHAFDGGFEPPRRIVDSVYSVRSHLSSGYGLRRRNPFVVAVAATSAHVHPSPSKPRQAHRLSQAIGMFATAVGVKSGAPSTMPVTLSGLPSRISQAMLVKIALAPPCTVQSPTSCGGPGQHPGQTESTCSQVAVSLPLPVPSSPQRFDTLSPSGLPPARKTPSQKSSTARGSYRHPTKPLEYSSTGSNLLIAMHGEFPRQ